MPHQRKMSLSPTANLTASVCDASVVGQPRDAVDANVGITRQLVTEWIERGKHRESPGYEPFLIQQRLDKLRVAQRRQWN